MTGAAITVLALAEPFIAAGAAVAFIRCSLLFFKGPHGLVVPPRHWYFFPIEKGLGPRGYERNQIMNSWWVPPSIREISYLMKIRFLPVAKIICVFCLETKGTKSSRKNDASTAQGKTPGPPFFHPTAQEL